jgi:hypothetical protein
MFSSDSGIIENEEFPSSDKEGKDWIYRDMYSSDYNNMKDADDSSVESQVYAELTDGSITVLFSNSMMRPSTMYCPKIHYMTRGTHALQILRFEEGFAKNGRLKQVR